MSRRAYIARINRLTAELPLTVRNSPRARKAIVDLRSILADEHIPRKPMSTGSDFKAQVSLGSWAEHQLCVAINNADCPWQALPYGEDAPLDPWHPQFDASWERYLALHRKEGRRPDLLLFPRKLGLANSGDEIASLREIAERHVKQAIAGFEIRSSRMMASQRTEESLPLKVMVKPADMPGTLRWIANTGAKYFYLQAFCDELHLLSFEDILRLTVSESPSQCKVVRQDRNQSKVLLGYPLEHASLIGTVVTQPEMSAHRVLADTGRVVDYIEYDRQSGKMEVDADRLAELIAR